MGERSRRLAVPFVAIAAGLLLGSSAGTSSAPAPTTIYAGKLLMTGMVVDPSTINAGKLTMTGMIVDPVIINAGKLNMTGMASQ